VRRAELLAESAEGAAAIAKLDRPGLMRPRCAVCGHATPTLRTPWDVSLAEPDAGAHASRDRCSARRPVSLLASLSTVDERTPEPDGPLAASGGTPGASLDGAAAQGRDGAGGANPVGSLDGVSSFMGIRWTDAQTVRLQIRPELINAGGLLSGVVTYAMVDYCMGSTLWVETTEEERIATISISINYIQTATEGELICHSVLDRRNRSNAVMRSEVHHEDRRLLVTAIGSYAIFVPRSRRR
jgi:acyl-coenzyme A thioesterase PaaI-like protein